MSEKMVLFEGQKSEALGTLTSASLIVKILKKKVKNMNEDPIGTEVLLNLELKFIQISSKSFTNTKCFLFNRK